MEVRALSWNLFHGRDHPPEAELRTLRSRILRTTERGEAHAQVNRDLREAFVAALAEAEWDVALLQECPPRWAERLATACGAEPHLALTSRNIPGLGRLQGLLADWDPDLIASWEGGSNLTLVRTSMIAGAGIAERRTHRLALRPERRVMAFSRLAGGVCVANLHASAEREAAERELLPAARLAVEWAAGWPLILGGDFNLRPESSGHVFAQLADELGLAPATAPRVIDHLLSRGLDVIEAPRQWALERREAPDPTASAGSPLPIVLSDHAPVEALFATARGRNARPRSAPARVQCEGGCDIPVSHPLQEDRYGRQFQQQALAREEEHHDAQEARREAKHDCVVIPQDLHDPQERASQDRCPPPRRPG